MVTDGQTDQVLTLAVHECRGLITKLEDKIHDLEVCCLLWHVYAFTPHRNHILSCIEGLGNMYEIT